MSRATPLVAAVLITALALAGCPSLRGPGNGGRMPGVVTTELWLDDVGRIDKAMHQDPDLFVGDRLRWECANCPEGVGFEVVNIHHTAVHDSDLTYLLSSEDIGLESITAAFPRTTDEVGGAQEAPDDFGPAIERIDAFLKAVRDIGRPVPEPPAQIPETVEPDLRAASCRDLAKKLHALLRVLEQPLRRPEGVPESPFGPEGIKRGDGYYLSPPYADIPGDHLWKFTWVLIGEDGSELERWDPHFSGHGGDTDDWGP